MGLDAGVMCTCLRDGATTPPPFPRDWICVDDEGYLTLVDAQHTPEREDRLLQWAETCCPHPEMWLALERISNWAGVRDFKAALALLGAERFPVLLRELPGGNGGMLAPAVAAQALDELARFEAAGAIGSNAVLVETATGEPVIVQFLSGEGLFLFGEGRSAGLDAQGLFLIDAETGAIIFRCRQLHQSGPEGGPITDAEAHVRWRDLETGQVCDTAPAIAAPDAGPGGAHRFPATLQVETRPRMPADFGYILRPLATVFAASVQTGNPVMWF